MLSLTRLSLAGGEFSIHRLIIAAVAIIVGLLGGAGVWAATATLSGAVIAPGSIVVERNVKKVQHSHGGIIAEIGVKNGDRVEAGQIVLRLDATQVKAELGVLRSQLVEHTARRARLIAERDGESSVTFPRGFLESGSDAREAAAGETRLFEESKKAKDSQKEQLRQKISQSNDEIVGVRAQRDAKTGELELVDKEVKSVRGLFAKNLATTSRLNGLERDLRRLSGEVGSADAQIARLNGQISEINIQIIGIDETARATAQRDLRSTDARIAELIERETAAKDRLDRVDIRAPRTGLVHDLAVHTVGGVISPAEQLMLIVPEEDGLAIQARVSPADVAQISVGRSARLRLSAFDQQTTPEFEGKVVHVPGDVTPDPKTGQSHYIIRVEMDAKSKVLASGLKLIPGMPVEVFLSTGERTALSYLSKPFTDQMNRAFRER